MQSVACCSGCSGSARLCWKLAALLTGLAQGQVLYVVCHRGSGTICRNAIEGQVPYVCHNAVDGQVPYVAMPQRVRRDMNIVMPEGSGTVCMS
jgi:hypothetical protein